ncbi:hypothetical protein SEA_JUSTBECAUSE_339 [Streptomyces phage JustBecause]|nr:hypothetical protein SEA_JUSTBECAUSE_339 [Streptomyces phage JustBecause]
MGNTFVALNIDGDARFYGLGARGVGHVVLIPSGMHSDPLACESVEKACDGKPLDSARLAEKFAGDKRCARCVKWLESDGGKNDLEAARQDKWDDENGPGLASIMGEFTLITLDDVVNVTADGSDARENSAPVPAAEIVKDAAAAGVKAPARKGGKRGKRKNSAPVATGDVCASTGLTFAAMRDAVATYYANGGEVPQEIATLPDPYVKRPAPDMTGAVGGPVPAVLPCDYAGPVSKLNMERTHGKCPGCSAYIPLLPERESKESGPKVSKIACAGVGSAPAPGTRVQRDDHSVSVPDDFQGKTSAPCGTCARVIAVSRDGVMRRHNGVEVRESAGECPDKIGTHNVGGAATPAHKGLTSRMIETVEHGSTPGDTATADKRRATESRCTRSRKVLSGRKTPGTVECPGCARPVELKAVQRKKGTVYVIPEHVRAGESVKHVGGGDVRDVTPRGEGADVGATVTRGKVSARLALSRGHGSVDGAANTGSQNMAPVQPKGWIGKAGTGQLPATVRPGIDPEVTGRECVLCGELPEIAHKGKSRGWRRRHSSMVGAVLRERKAKRDAERAAAIARGEIASTAERKAGRKAASVGSFAEGTCAGVVSHEPRPEFAPKGERRPAGWKAGEITRATARKALDGVARKAGK